MYSVVLAAVLTTGSAAPGWFGCHGCWGCHGCHGCWGGCHGCWGCHGCHGCWGGCYGGCYGSCYGLPSGWGYFSGCYGYAGCHGGYGGAVVPGTPATTPATTPTTTPQKEPKSEVRGPTPAEVIVNLPPDAKLFVDGQRIELTPNTHSVVTPTLQPGQDYFYMIRAEAVRDGKTVEENRRVIVRAGYTTTLDFPKLEPVAQKEEARPSRITVRMPENGRLFVDGNPVTMTADTRTFNTPRLEPGKSYYYTLKAEVVRNGKTRSEDRRVVVEAGKEVTVDFTPMAEPVATAQR